MMVWAFGTTAPFGILVLVFITMAVDIAATTINTHAIRIIMPNPSKSMISVGILSKEVRRPDPAGI